MQKLHIKFIKQNKNVIIMIQNAAVTHIDATEDGELITMKLDSKYVNYYFEF